MEFCRSTKRSFHYCFYIGFAKTVFKQRAKTAKADFDKISKGITSSDFKKRFCVAVFLQMMDILSCQVINRFEGMKSVLTSHQVLEPSFLSNASHLDPQIEGKKFLKIF